MQKKGVFIIESLEFEDEKDDLFEGKFLSRILDLGGIETEYFYIRTKKELEEVLEIFKESNFRYLHFSCHGSEKSIETTLDSINFQLFSELVTPYLKFKRLFISACSVVNKNLAKEIFPFVKCYSLIGFDKEVYFSDAAITWASFYHIMLKKDRMTYDDISPLLKKLSELYQIPINYFQASKTAKSKFKLKRFKLNKKAST
tara:strand:- start:4069 stop:4671 length:603 start_codon:yes stop_codon:yes gene_type:complete